MSLMPRSMAILAIGLLAGTPTERLSGQSVLAPKMNLSVTVQSVATRGDTTEVRFTVANLAVSRAPMLTFYVDTPIPNLRVVAPVPSPAWVTSTSFGTKKVAAWSLLDPPLQPGTVTPTMMYAGVGLPDFVSWWAAADVEPDTLLTGDAPPDGPSPVAADGSDQANVTRGRMIGIAPFPANRTPTDLKYRMQAFVNGFCQRGDIEDVLIDNIGICTSITQKIYNGAFDALINDLDAQRGKHIKESAYWILRGYAQHLAGATSQ